MALTSEPVAVRVRIKSRPRRSEPSVCHCSTGSGGGAGSAVGAGGGSGAGDVRDLLDELGGVAGVLGPADDVGEAASYVHGLAGSLNTSLKPLQCSFLSQVTFFSKQ